MENPVQQPISEKSATHRLTQRPHPTPDPKDPQEQPDSRDRAITRAHTPPQAAQTISPPHRRPIGGSRLSKASKHHPEWIDLVIHIGQEGRGCNVFFTLGGQRLDLSSLSKVKSNIAFRVALRAETAEDSRDVIGSDAA